MTGRDELDVDTVLEALQALNDGIAIYGPDDRQLFVNDVAYNRFKTYYQGMADGLSHQDALLAANRKGMPEASEEQVAAMAEEHFGHFRTGQTYMTRTEQGRMVLATFRQMSHGRKAGISVDITDLRNREKELDKAKKAAEAASQSKSAFLANMSHEIRTPLNGIMGMAQVLESTSLDIAQKEFVATILESGKTLMALLNDVLDLSKIEAGRFDIVPADASLHHMLRRQLKLWKPRSEEKGIELSLAFDAELPAYLSFDQVRVQQCVSNLVSNAIKFTARGRVEIFASAKPMKDGAHQVDIQVRDTGPGMNEETLGRLFKPFAQADETIQRVHGGSGLGLSITRRLAELMGGSASATSEVGRGSVFRVSFLGQSAKTQPEAGVNARAIQSEIRDVLKRSNLRVLLVDDHPINRQVATLFMRPFNMRVVEAANGAEAIEALKREAFDLVLLDMHMPVMDGPTTIAHIRASNESWRNIRVVALTADVMSGDRERYLGMGMNGYLSKPLAERDLLSEIQRVCSDGTIFAPASNAA